MSTDAAPSEPQKLIFAQAFEGLFLLGLKDDLSSELKAKLRSQGLDLDLPLLPAYSYAVWQGALHEAVRHLWPDLPLEQGYHQIGRKLVEGYQGTLLGKALATMMRVLGPRRTLARMEQNLRTADNAVTVAFEQLDANRVRLDMNDCTQYPSYFAGVFQAATELSGGKDVEVSVVLRHPPGAVYEVRWA